MHRFISSRDVEEYSTDVQPRDIQLTKDEDIEYRSGTLYSSSGTTFVEILTFSQGTQQQLADEEEPSNLTDSNTFTVNGSYTLDRMQCYTLSKSAAAQRNGRSVDNMVVTSLKATVNKREYLCTKSVSSYTGTVKIISLTLTISTSIGALNCAYIHSCTCRIYWQTTFGGPTTGTTITARDPNESSPGTREYTTWWVVISMFVYYVKL